MKSVRSCLLTALSIWTAAAQRHPAPQAPPDVAAPPAAATQEAPGLWMSSLTKSPGNEHPLPSDCVTYTFAAWRRNGALYSTSGPSGEPATQCLSAIMPGVAQALERMTPGDTRRIWLSGELSTPPRDDADSPDEGGRNVPLTLDLTLIKILKAPVLPPDHIHPSPRAELLPSGASMEFQQHGSGSAHPTARGKVVVSYTSWSEAGQVVETTIISGKSMTEPLVNVPLGWRDALPRMVAGDQVWLWVPATLISGPRAAPLIYNLKLIAVQ